MNDNVGLWSPLTTVWWVMGRTNRAKTTTTPPKQNEKRKENKDTWETTCPRAQEPCQSKNRAKTGAGVGGPRGSGGAEGVGGVGGVFGNRRGWGAKGTGSPTHQGHHFLKPLDKRGAFLGQGGPNFLKTRFFETS